MDKKLIERIALEVAKDIVFPGFEIDAVMSSALTKYAGAFLARIDAERGKSAAAVVEGVDVYTGFIKLLRKLNAGTNLFLSQTIPEGMAQDAKRFAFLQNLEPEKAQAFFWNYTSRRQRAKAIDEAMIAADKGERS